MWLLGTVKENFRELDSLAHVSIEPDEPRIPSTKLKCCWDDENLKNLITGFVRVVKYYKKRGSQTYLTTLYEGNMKNGEPYGFGRYVNSYQQQQFIGYFDGSYTTTE